MNLPRPARPDFHPPSPWPRRAGWLVAAALLIGSACAGHSRTVGDYARKAHNTIEAVDSSLQTALVTVAVIERGGAFTPYVGRVLGQAEADASASQGTFAAVQPPGADADRIRDRLEPLVADAVDVLARARIAARRDDLDAVVALRAELVAASVALRALEAGLP